MVYKTKAKPGSEWKDFNTAKGVERATTQAQLQQNVTIPYKQNRVVIFDSNLWHKTDNFHFKETYAKRRINFTMLFA